MNDYNKYFSCEDAMDEYTFQCLMAEKRVWATTCRMDRAKAFQAMPWGDPMRFDEEEATYGGLIVTSKPDDLQEAEAIAKDRGWGEVIEGVLYGVIPRGHEMINPFEIKNKN